MQVLAVQVRDAATAVPLMIAAPFLRPWHGRWGATDAELRQSLPGDDALLSAHVRWTRAITIGAPPKEVWPWLVQVGYDKARFYSNDLLDRLGRPSADELCREWQNVRVGEWVAMAANPTEKTAFRVAGFEEPHRLLWKEPDSTWSWRLTPSGEGRTPAW